MPPSLPPTAGAVAENHKTYNRSDNNDNSNSSNSNYIDYCQQAHRAIRPTANANVKKEGTSQDARGDLRKVNNSKKHDQNITAHINDDNRADKPTQASSISSLVWAKVANEEVVFCCRASSPEPEDALLPVRVSALDLRCWSGVSISLTVL